MEQEKEKDKGDQRGYIISKRKLKPLLNKENLRVSFFYFLFKFLVYYSIKYDLFTKEKNNQI